LRVRDAELRFLPVIFFFVDGTGAVPLPLAEISASLISQMNRQAKWLDEKRRSGLKR
jgi:hypothetical protein